MSNKAPKGELAFCFVCLVLGYIVPWGSLVSAGLISMVTTDPYWSETAAWLVAFGLAWLAVSYFWACFVHAIKQKPT